jgi:hypothetical protein
LIQVQFLVGTPSGNSPPLFRFTHPFWFSPPFASGIARRKRRNDSFFHAGEVFRTEILSANAVQNRDAFCGTAQTRRPLSLTGFDFATP